jgi:prevent-host-death family protein
MQTFTVNEFQSDFDNLMNRVEQGESFVITQDDSSVVILPYDSYEEMEELVRIHTNHNDGC